jgi:hypothetical protein
MAAYRKIDRSLRIRKQREVNPRRPFTHGAHAWDSIDDGMTVAAYLAAPYQPLPIRSGKRFHTFTGPAMRHLMWDLAHNYITLED